MTELISWLKEYSPAVVTLVAIGTATLYVLKLTVDKSIAASFDTHVQELELGLERRSAFRDKVLTERFPRITEQSSRLEKVMTNLNRLRHNNPVPEGFQKGNEIVPLTEIYEDLSIHCLRSPKDFTSYLLRRLTWHGALRALKVRTSGMVLLQSGVVLMNRFERLSRGHSILVK
jgi:hypothetical protein